MEETSIDKWNTKKIATKTVSHPNPPPVLHCLPLRNPLPTQDHRHHLFSTLCRKAPPSNKTTTIKPLNLVVENLEIAISATNPSIQSSSLRLAEKVLLSYPDSLLSSLLLSLIYIPQQPAHQCFHKSPKHLPSRPFIGSVMFPLLSKMSGDQALELKGLESIHEEDLDENCKVFAKYFKELVTNGDDNRIMTTPPSVILKELGKVDKSDASDEISKMEALGFKNGRPTLLPTIFGCTVCLASDTNCYPTYRGE
ncbi:RING-TYPE E3 UBIQUITIN TRANSFERASE [Salix viminalis]|uniref:RING-TYPE E3 UBIQUITIN TRANSFERASE n=1 Tax=Salix viminalis TaxID=40686 RepID=A0A9Q0SE93_SALVM|nr:RING-TYPE E3 UBIQUITIN TRANSFERASE [Salix viminalis]